MRVVRVRYRAAVLAVAAAAAVTVAGCGSDDPAPAPTSSSTQPPGESGSPTPEPGPPAPTVEQLRAMLARGLDTSIPASEKTDLVQGSDADPELINRLADAAKKNGVTIEVTGVNDLGQGQASADGTIALNGQPPSPAVVSLVLDNGKWKLEKTWTCSILQNAQIQSPACS